jgi:hypothetical protein
MNHLSRAVACAALAAAALMPATANAWWHGGVFIGVPPIVVGPPVYPYPYPYAYPPGYYYPPAPYAPGYYPPAGTAAPKSAPQSKAPQMSQANTPYGATCYAGFYTCAAAPQSHVGSGCTCPGIGAPSYGSVQ